MDRVAVFVDAGYLFAQGSVAISGEKLPRGGLAFDHGSAFHALARFAVEISQLPLLRIYWYDGTSTGPTSQHIALANLASVKVRLGFVNSVGEQKGVDSLIVTDMIALARNRAMADAVLLSGDEDLRVGVQQAQELGVRVHLLGIRPSRGSQSLFLLQEADSAHEWGPDDLTPFLSCRVRDPKPEPTTTTPFASSGEVTPISSSVSDPLERIAIGLASELPPGELAPLVEAIRRSGQIPKELDGRLLAKSGALLGAPLNQLQKRGVRASFLSACEALLEDAGPRTTD